jgi:hypothetical protein
MTEPPEVFLGERRNDPDPRGVLQWYYRFEYFNLHVYAALGGGLVGTKPISEKYPGHIADSATLLNVMCVCVRNAMVPYRIKHQEALKEMQKEMHYFKKLKDALDQAQGVNEAPTFWERLR